MGAEQINPWIRANQSGFDPATLALINPAYQEEYTRLMKERQHRLGILALSIQQEQDAQARVAEIESECQAFFFMMERYNGTA